ncbi:Tetratricopeptide repeat-containing protein [Phyllobacterium sp. CL33Tsu]|uniref:TIR domain-containing protein n=1 Tax=Phyllobacterium sp. CL33Tsu TaxID=1798191 RepID=UPI0008F3A254|nr:TIR domain-containing protein [Phyllobacterium sp. CL33Tsu]SFI64504.1 Tetratricopeptide repeat-containing protein [Phyllobacterium sp. CL33Tsu]
MKSIHGNIFLSHASEDKDIVRTVYERLDTASAFFDVQSIDSGQKTIDAMESGVAQSSVFVLFHSPNSNKTWVNFEKDRARIQSILRKETKILVCAVKGETYKTLPSWMQSYMTTGEQYRSNDIIRSILRLQTESIREQTGTKELFVGRETLLRQIELEVLGAPAKVGMPLQHIVLAGLPGMGRSTLANNVIENSFSAMRPAGPIFDLPDMSEAVDIYLRIKEDLDGVMSKAEIESQIAMFQTLDVEKQVDYILKSLSHWAELNQVITLRTRWGLRDRSRRLKVWVEQLFRKSTSIRNLRIVYISERKLPVEEIARLGNVAQYEVSQLENQDIQYILSKKIEGRFFDPNLASDIASKIRGHPSTALHVAYLTNGGMSFDSINSNPEPIYSFHDHMFDGIFAGNSLSDIQFSILNLLGWFPKLSISIIERVFNIKERKEIVEEIWGLLDYSLLYLGEGGFYHVPDVVAAKIKRSASSDHKEIFVKVGEIIQDQIKAGYLEAELIDAFLISVVETGGDLPDELLGIVTSASLLSLVQEQFLAARSSKDQKSVAYDRIYKMSKLAFKMSTSDDAVEQILFTGGDSAIRSGQFPADIIDFMNKKALPSVYYLIGSFAFHVEKDFAKAASNLEKALALKHFRTRNTRLLARCYVRAQRFDKAKDLLEKLPERQLFADSGLLVLMIRALRGMRLNRQADDLERQLQSVTDEFGNVSLYLAGRAVRESKFDLARKHIRKAQESPRVNQLSVALLECSVAIESGDATLLPQTVEMAISAGRQYDAWALQARMSLVGGNWQEALDLLAKIQRKDFFDLSIEHRALQMKKTDKDILRDPILIAEVQKREEEILRLSVNAPEGFRDA